MKHKGNYANKHNTHTILVANVSSDRLGSRGVIFYWTNLLGKRYTRGAITPYSIVKATKLHGICYHRLWKC